MTAAFSRPLPIRNLLRPRIPPATCRMAHSSAAPTEEHFDILNADGTPAGFSKPRSEVHKAGYLHRSTHMWLLSREGKVLLQKRSLLKDTFPGCWDVSAAGHISAGDRSRPSALRELEEELGVRLENEAELEFVMSCHGSASGCTELHGKFIDNEIQDVYVYVPRETIPIESFVLQTEEVQEVAYWDADLYLEAIRSGDVSFVPRSRQYIENFFPWFERQITTLN